MGVVIRRIPAPLLFVKVKFLIWHIVSQVAQQIAENMVLV